ncbi:hypothetical protein Goklo_009766 [Gossypium klotzschianum]|uniref:Uncharacterized protein n=1 Tax=Gossypium klotzschianum TaxID=34286 RepID=A0A7J8V465_9ROSI|nr:hypothetical protein [Gossypium klotzschianum]
MFGYIHFSGSQMALPVLEMGYVPSSSRWKWLAINGEAKLANTVSFSTRQGYCLSLSLHILLEPIGGIYIGSYPFPLLYIYFC